MAFGRSKCVLNRVVTHHDLVDRIRKSLYFGEGDETIVEQNLSLPLASYASELFSKSHKGYSLNRLSTYNAGKTQANPCSLIMALIFLERLNAIDPAYVRRITPQELFIVSMMISTKFYIGYDEEIYLSDWAAEGNMTDNKLKELELEFLSAIDWNIYISNEEFFKKLSEVEKTLAHREGLPRGWLTYTELIRMLPSMVSTKNLINALLNHIAVLMVSYAAGVLTILGAFFLASRIPGHILHRDSRIAANASSSNTLNAANISDAINDQRQMEIHLNSSVDSVVQQHNATCRALNAEDELLKLERQYQKEEEELKGRHRNNEIDHHNLNFMLPTMKLISPTRDYGLKRQEQKWIAIKEMYSELCNSEKPIERHESESKKENSHNLPTVYCENFGNKTRNMFWKMLSESSKPSFVRFPLVWFKFI